MGIQFTSTAFVHVLKQLKWPLMSFSFVGVDRRDGLLLTQLVSSGKRDV